VKRKGRDTGLLTRAINAVRSRFRRKQSLAERFATKVRIFGGRTRRRRRWPWLVAVSALAFGVGCWALWIRLFDAPESVPGWASTVVPIAFLGGIQLLSLGVIGEYLSKTYAETKRRPRFIVEKTI
jgi:hypothetical protein